MKNREKYEASIPPEDMPKWAFDLYDIGIPVEEIKEMMSRLYEPYAKREETPSIYANARIPEKEIPKWADILGEGRSAEDKERIRKALRESNMSARDKKILSGRMRVIKIKGGDR